MYEQTTIVVKLLGGNEIENLARWYFVSAHLPR